MRSKLIIRPSPHSNGRVLRIHKRHLIESTQTLFKARRDGQIIEVVVDSWNPGDDYVYRSIWNVDRIIVSFESERLARRFLSKVPLPLRPRIAFSDVWSKPHQRFSERILAFALDARSEFPGLSDQVLLKGPEADTFATVSELAGEWRKSSQQKPRTRLGLSPILRPFAQIAYSVSYALRHSPIRTIKLSVRSWDGRASGSPGRSKDTKPQRPFPWWRLRLFARYGLLYSLWVTRAVRAKSLPLSHRMVGGARFLTLRYLMKPIYFIRYQHSKFRARQVEAYDS